MFGLNAGAVSVNMVDSPDIRMVRSVEDAVADIDRYGVVSVLVREVYGSVGVFLGEGVRSSDALAYALGRMSGEEASEFRKGLEVALGAVSKEDLGTLYGKLDKVRRFVRRIPGTLRCV